MGRSRADGWTDRRTGGSPDNTGTLNTFGLPFKLRVTEKSQGRRGCSPSSPSSGARQPARPLLRATRATKVFPLSLPPAHNKDGAAAASADEGAIPPPPPSGNGGDADDEKRTPTTAALPLLRLR
ncbi:hypothetical protein K438DRAFT_1972416 [Mycena galopus ATCC 62051]|nr:hypothetical protein K438DRAFT_1972416 [Mycena galopus ATCC 62051]